MSSGHQYGSYDRRYGDLPSHFDGQNSGPPAGCGSGCGRFLGWALAIFAVGALAPYGLHLLSGNVRGIGSTTAAPLAGTWTGEVRCSGDNLPARVRLTFQGGNPLTATFEETSLPNGRPFPPSSNGMSGSQSNLTFELQPVSGTPAILDNHIGISGELRTDGAIIDAHLTNTKEACTSIALTPG